MQEPLLEESPSAGGPTGAAYGTDMADCTAPLEPPLQPGASVLTALN